MWFFDPRVVMRLLYNYRALPSIMVVNNKLSMPIIREDNSGEAVCDIVPQSPNRPKTHGIFFRGMRSEDMCNPYEAKEIFHLS
ncbi:putative RNA helicase armi isoform 1-T2 [Glossina fuscipes fuscipes]